MASYVRCAPCSALTAAAGDHYTDNFCNGRRGDTPFGRMRVRVVYSDHQVPMKNMISCMRTPCVARSPSQACQRARRASAQSHTRHAKPEAIGSWGRVRRTSYPNGTRAESQPLRKGHADHAPPSGETTGFRDAFWFFQKSKVVQNPGPWFPCVRGEQHRRACSQLPLAGKRAA